MLDLEQYVPEEYMSLYQVCKELGKLQKKDYDKCNRIESALETGVSWYYFKLFIRCISSNESVVKPRLSRIKLMTSLSSKVELTKEEEGVLRNNFLLSMQDGDLLYDVNKQ